jgi:hypothetical protein
MPVVVGATSVAPSPTTSGSEAAFEQMVGAPHAIASSAGSPNPSYSDGTTTSVARL